MEYLFTCTHYRARLLRVPLVPAVAAAVIVGIPFPAANELKMGCCWAPCDADRRCGCCLRLFAAVAAFVAASNCDCLCSHF